MGGNRLSASFGIALLIVVGIWSSLPLPLSLPNVSPKQDSYLQFPANPLRLRFQLHSHPSPPTVVDTPVWVASTVEPARSVTLSANGSYIVVVSDDVAGYGDSHVLLFNNTSGTPMWNYTWEKSTLGSPREPSMSDDGMFFVVSTSLGRLFLFNRTSSTPMWTRSIGGVVNARISGDGTYIAAASTAGDLHLFHRGSSTQNWTFSTTEELLGVAISRNGSLIAAGGDSFGGPNHLFVFNTTSNVPLWNYTLTSNAECHSIDITDDGSHIVFGEMYGSENAYLFNSTSAIPQWTFPVGEATRDIEVSNDSRYIAIGTEFHAVLLDGVTGTLFWNYSSGGSDHRVSLTANGEYLLVGTQPGPGVFFFNKSSDVPEWQFDNPGNSYRVALSDVGNFFVFTIQSQARLYRNLLPPSAPVLIDPGEVDGDGAFDVDWSDSNDLDGEVSYYELQMDNDTVFSPPLLSWYPSSSIQAVSGLTNDTYHFRVRAVDDDGQLSEWSNVENITVTILNSPPSTPTLFDPGEIDTDGNVTVNWSDATDTDGSVIGYQLQMDQDEFFNSPDQNWYPMVSNIDVEGLTNGTYWFRARAKDDDLAWSEWSNKHNITVEITNDPPSTPVLLDPGDIDPDGDFLVNWSDSTDSDGTVTNYELQMDTDSGFLSPILIWYPSISEQAITGLTDGQYFFRVRAQDDFGSFSSWSDVENITVLIPNQPPSIPTLYDPGDVDDDGNFAVNWTAAIDLDGFVTGYQLQMDNNSDFLSVEKVWAPSMSNQMVLGVLDGLWYFRVRAQDDDLAFGEWSNVVTITVSIPQVDMLAPTITNLQLSPGSPKAGQTVYILATINDSSGILNVTLFYRVNSQNWLSVVMTETISNVYGALIPAFSKGTIIEYYVRAYDASPQYNMAEISVSSFIVEASIPTPLPPMGDPYLLLGYGLNGLAVILAILALVLFLVFRRKKKLV